VKRIVLSGATGFVGGRLAARLRERGDEVLEISRRPGAAVDWSPARLERALEHSDALVHLAGENLFARRWTPRFKAELVESRVATAALLAGLVARRPGLAFVSASAVGFYGASTARGLDEAQPAGRGFLAELCRAWEAATEPAATAGARTAIVRIGLVLGRDQGVLARLVPLFRCGLGGRAGDGAQWVSWIHIDDLTALLTWLVDQSAARGVYNATAPEPATNAELTRTLARVLHRPALFPLPAFAARLLLGEAADALLTGQHVVPARALREGFAFRFSSLEPALQDLCGRAERR